MIRFLAGLWLAVLVAATPGPCADLSQADRPGRRPGRSAAARAGGRPDLASSAALETQTGRQFVVATVNSLEGRTIEDYGYRLGRAWGIGDEEKDDGVILLVAPNERKVRIETGYGARVFLTDAVSSVIIRERILPQVQGRRHGRRHHRRRRRRSSR